jgi:hypothetical protein
MSNEKKKGHSVGLSKVIGLAFITLLVGMAVGTALGIMVIEPALQNLHFGKQGNTNNQNNGQNNNNNPGSTDNDYTGNQQPLNSNPPPSTPTGYYGGNGQFNAAVPVHDGTVSGQINANIDCVIGQDGNNISMSLTFTPTSVSEGLQQAITIGNSVTFNFAGTSSGTQFSGNAQGSVGQATFSLNINGSVDQDELSFTIMSNSDSQLSISTTQTITLHPN